MRIVGGELRGRRLRAPPPGVRPTSDRVRESLFAKLGDVAEARVLDLYAGTGALGIEALSRGAERAVFVERSARNARVLRQNLEALELGDRTRLLVCDAARAARSLRSEAGADGFDLVLADPPYDDTGIGPALAALLAEGTITARTTLVVEGATRHDWAPVAGLDLVEERRYGDTVLRWLHVGADESRAPGDRVEVDGSRDE